MADTLSRFNGLILSANDLRVLTDWPDALIEDYLNLFESLSVLANTVDEKNDIIKAVTVVDPSMSPYEIRDTDEDVFFNTDDGDVVANLGPGTEGRNYRLLNVGEKGNIVTLNPFGAEHLFGQNESELIIDSEVLIITFNPTHGWY